MVTESRGYSAGGRYLADLWQLDLDNLEWSCTTAAFGAGGDEAAAMPPCAGMVVLPHRGRILVVGGHTKDKRTSEPLMVRVLDPAP